MAAPIHLIRRSSDRYSKLYFSHYGPNTSAFYLFICLSTNLLSEYQYASNIYGAGTHEDDRMRLVFISVLVLLFSTAANAGVLKGVNKVLSDFNQSLPYGDDAIR